MYDEAVTFIKEKIDMTPVVGIILGSGLSGALTLNNEQYVNYEDIPGFPVATVKGHTGRFVFGTYGNINVVIMEGRIHYYEGYPMEKVVMPVRIMALLGIKHLIITNAAGGINERLCPGDIMVIKDHISSFLPSPLLGPNDDSLGTRFPDMTNVYDREGVKIIEKVMLSNRIKSLSGTYVQVTGPQYETPAEVKMFRMMGADAVGMSSVCEAIAARHMNVSVMGLSVISNKASNAGVKTNHQDILDIVSKTSEKMNIVLRGILDNILV